jgi:site-specific DNA-methyltransferase (adenine-specific)
MKALTSEEQARVFLELIEKLRVNNEFTNNPSPFTPNRLVRRLLKKISRKNHLSKSVLVAYTLEVAVELWAIGKKNVNITTRTLCPKTRWIAQMLGYKYYTLEELKNMSMKFDVIIGNPPYQDDSTGDSTKTTNLYAPFFYEAEKLLNNTGILSMIIPSDWIGPNKSSFKNYIFNSKQIKEIELHPYQKYFKVKKATCNVILDKTYVGDCSFIDEKGHTEILDLSKQEFLSKDNSDIAFRRLFAGHKNMGHRWLRGKLNRNQIVVDSTGVEYIEGCGKAGASLDIKKIPVSLETTGAGLHKIVMPNVGGTKGDLGNNVKIAESHQVGGHGVVFLTTASKAESENLFAYLNTKPIKELIKRIKTSSPNSKALFEKIPDVDLSIKWDDQKVYNHFGFDKDTIKYVESL